MAKAKVFFRFEGSGWSGPFGTGSSAQSDGNTAKDHAERAAWREANDKLQEWYDKSHKGFEGKGAEVKIWLDQIVCPQCQLWMIAGVLRNLADYEFKPKLFVEVNTGGETYTTAAITRDYVWPVTVRHKGFDTLQSFKEYNKGRSEKDQVSI